jgi:hypothetical protein
MLRLFFRFVGLLLLAGAFAALVVDGTRSVAAGTPAILPLGRTASSLFPTILVTLHRTMEAHSPLLWDPIAVSILLLPAWLVLGLLGLALMALTRKRVEKIGFQRR